MAYRNVMVNRLSREILRQEALSSAAVTPGHLLVLDSTLKVKPCATANIKTLPIFAVEDDLQGNEIGTAYASGALVQYETARSGDEVYAFLANGQSATKGDRLVPHTGGELATLASSDEEGAVIAIALETLDMSGSSGADPSSNRILVKIV